MPLSEGEYIGTILEHDIRSSGSGKEFIYVLFETPDGKIAAQIWLTLRARNMAKQQLKACGFDYKVESLVELKANRHKLAGNKVPITVREEEYKGQSSLKAMIVTENAVTKERIEKLDGLLKAKDEPEEEDDIPF